MAKDYFLGVDGGGTKTAAVVIDGEATELARAVSGPSNFYTVGPTATEASLREAIHQVLAQAGLVATELTAIGLGLAGVDRPHDRELVRGILSRVAQFSRIVIGNDAEAALVGSVGRRHGVVLIAGTGAIAYGVNARGEARRADGWGYLVGDEGSALWIGIQGLRAVARAHDGRGPATELTTQILSFLGIQEASALVTLIYADDFGVPQLAGLAPRVSQAARDGDAVAQEILHEAGRRLGKTLKAVIQSLDMVDEAFEVVLMGGVLQARDLVRETVLAALRETAARARVVEPRYDAAVGAALLAQQTKG